jgi:hypothetical protein
MNSLKEQMIALYRKACFTIETPHGVYELCHDNLNIEFKKFLHRNRISQWGLISSDNPRAVRLPELKNQVSRERLAKLIEKYISLRAVAMSKDNDIHEIGYFIAHITRDELCRLGRMFEQSIVFCGDQECNMEIVWLQD